MTGVFYFASVVKKNAFCLLFDGLMHWFFCVFALFSLIERPGILGWLCIALRKKHSHGSYRPIALLSVRSKNSISQDDLLQKL